MPRRGARLAILACLIALSASPALAATPQQVDAAIKKGVAFIYSKQNEKGNWEMVANAGADPKKEQSNPNTGQWGGISSIATYALLDSGESWKDKRIHDAVEWLNKAPLLGIYAIGLRAQVWQYLPQTKPVKAAAQRDAGLLMGGMKRAGDARAMWYYLVNDGPAARYDHSISQIALLGVWACQQAGREVPLAFWQESERAWKAHQNEDGGWSYIYKAAGEHGQSKLSMTLAGVATLFMAEDYVHMNDGIACKGNVFDEALVRGTTWVYGNAGGGGGLAPGGMGYTLYGMQRVALASGYKYFNTYDWYKEAAEMLVNGQRPDGSWDGDRGGPVVSTAWAVIVLSRGRAPVIMNKLEYELLGTAPAAKVVPKPVAPPPPPLKPGPARPGATPAPVAAPAPAAPAAAPAANAPDPNAPPPVYTGNWCQRPRDVAQFTRWMTEVTERKLAWQILSNKNTVDDYHDAPVLYMSGNQKLALPKETVDKLRQYIEEGGLLYGQADCGSKEFTDSFKELGKQLFPMYEFRELPADHPIFTRQQFYRRNWKNPPSVLGLSNGARELMVTMPGTDFARNWQTMAYLGNEASFQSMNSIALYAVDRQNLRYKGATHVIRPAGGGGRAIKVARLEFPGNWNPEPAGWRRLAALLGNQNQATLTVETVNLGDGKLDAAVYPIAHLTGTGQFSFTKEQVAELRMFVLKGGTVVCDAAGGDGIFGASAEAQLAQIITGSKFESLMPEDAALGMPPGTQSASAGVPMVTPPPPLDPDGSNSSRAASTQPTKGLLPDPDAGGHAPPATAPTTAATTAPTTAPDTVKTLLPPDFTVEYRSFAKIRLGASQALRLKGIKFRGRWAVIYSAEDLSVGLVGHPVDGIHGYTPASATEIMRRLVINLTAPKPATADAPK